ncbi:MAG TPA: zinc-binding dehydrogenase [Dehalococcoidia bacterium]|nr:zinc-binding dehydrogenase [Dehalococcoidia bacterium]
MKTRTCVKMAQKVVEMQDLDIADPGPGEVIVRTTMATICGSDIHLLDEIPLPPGLPMGHEAVGVVEAVGPGVTRFKPGDRVAASCLNGCGSCDRCLEGNIQLCQTFGAPMNLLFGCQGQFFKVRGADVSMAHVPSSVDDEHAVLATDIMSTGFGAIERANMRPGDTVAIFAQGPVGLCATAGAKLMGAGRIITVESVPERIEMSKRLGADIVLDPQNAVAEIMALTGNRGVDVAVEALGHQVTFENCCAVVRMGGTVSSVGVYGAFPTLTMSTSGSFLHRQIVTTFCPSGRPRLEQLFNLVANGKVNLRGLFTHRMKLEEAPKAYDLFRERKGGVLKIALEP